MSQPQPHFAFDEHGEPISLPENASGWRVRRMKGTRGAPGLVYGDDGTPLLLPRDADLEELRREVGSPGRYKLEAVDEQRCLLKAPAAIVVLAPGEGSSEDGAEAAPSAPRASALEPMAVVMEALRQNAEMATTIVERFPAMLESAAGLLRAADGAGLPRREPWRYEGEEGEEDEGSDAQPPASPGAQFDLNTLVAQLVPVLFNALGKGDLPSLAEMLDWRRAKKSADAAKAQAAERAGADGSSARAKPTAGKPATGRSAAAEAESKAAGASAETGLPPLSPEALAHFLAIQAALTPEEAALARAAAAELAPRDLRAWFDELRGMSVPEAAQRVRALLTTSKSQEAA